MNLSDVNKKFGIDNRIAFTTGKGGFIYANIQSLEASAQVSLYGAHVLHYVPKGKEEVLWNTGKSFFEKGKPIRGGIPVCWPWFGPHGQDQKKPAHGFARLSEWEVTKTLVTVNEETELTLSLSDSPETKALWPFSFHTTITIRLGEKLTVELSITNTGSEKFTFTDALHSYLRVGDASRITIEGLEGCTYLDGTNNNESKIQSEKLVEIKKEENRRYLNTASDCILTDPSLDRKILIEKQNSNTTVVWNPWAETAKAFADMGDHDYKTMVCVEAANAYNEIISLEPGKTFSLSTTLSTF
jgi:D-hexose-6-phosphate mutarotase